MLSLGFFSQVMHHLTIPFHFFCSLRRMLVLYLVAKSVQPFCNPLECSLPVSSVHGISQARIQELVAISGDLFIFPGDLSNSRTEPASPELAGRFFTELPQKPQKNVSLLENSHSTNASQFTLTLIQSLRHLRL